MRELTTIFTDGLSNVNFINGMVRLTIGTVQAVANNNGEISAENSEFVDQYNIIMPLNTFLNAFNSQKQLIDKLIDNKVIAPKEETTEESVIIPETK